MNHPQQSTPGILVIANRTCPCPTLADEVARRARARRPKCSWWPQRSTRACATGSPTSMTRWCARTIGSSSRSASCARGISAHGEVGDSDPTVAIADALANFAATEIVIATHPAGQSNWLERGLIENASARFDIPITHLVSSYGLVQAGAAA